MLGRIGDKTGGALVVNGDGVGIFTLSAWPQHRIGWICTSNLLLVRSELNHSQRIMADVGF